MEIRRLTQDDIPECLHIVRRNWSLETAQSCHVELGQSFGTAVWRPIFYVACDAAILGLAGYSVSWMNYGIYDITWVNVDPSHQRRGVGKSLVDRCLHDISAVGSLVMLSTDKPEYYEQHWGFLRCFTHDGHVIMRLVLGERSSDRQPV
jgi:ribosomal protein S18 acetylase RimI-like enzyme